MKTNNEPTTEEILEAFGGSAATIIAKFGSLYGLAPQAYQTYVCQQGHCMADRIINEGCTPVHTVCLLCGAKATTQGRVTIPNSKQFRLRAWFRPRPNELQVLMKKDPVYAQHILDGGLALSLTPMGVRAKKIPWQKRNEVCQCGSGEKFKHCCGREFGA